MSTVAQPETLPAPAVNTRRDATAYDALLDAIYDAPLEPDGWAHAMQLLSAALGDSAIMFGIQPFDRNLRASIDQPVGVDGGLIQRFIEECGVFADNPLVGAFAAAPIGETFHFEHFVGRRTIETSGFFEIVGKPTRLVNYLGLTVERNTEFMVPISILRTADRPDYGAAETRLLQELSPHLRRASRVHLELGAVRDSRDAFEAALWPLACGVILLKPDRRIAFMNAVAKRLVDEGDGLRCRAGRLEAARPAERGLLDRACAVAADRRARHRPGESLKLSRPFDGHLPCMVMPIAERRMDSFDERPCVMLVFREPDAATGNATGHLSRLYGLSPRQAQLAEMLMLGLNLPDIAAQLAITTETARTHLKRVYEKTDTRNQGELIRLIASGPMASLTA